MRNNKKMKKFVKISLISIFFVLAIAIFSIFIFIGVTYYKYTTLDINTEVLQGASVSACVYDSENRLIKSQNMSGTSYISLEKLPSFLQDSFISIEDKSFYSHKGVNAKRMIGAMIKNIKSGSFKEGASTITQQLIKNTHLSSEKTLERKLKEIALARKVEKRYTKEEILEFYLNAIYFGNNTYGINDASNFYFSKSASKLNLQESALLAGMIKSPKNYDPTKNNEKAKLRRNLVLSEMVKDGKITENEYILAKNTEIELNLNLQNGSHENTYENYAIEEACSVLDMTPKQLALSGAKIYTYKNQENEKKLQNLLNSQNFNSDYASIAIDNHKFAITAFAGRSAYKLLDAKRSPASCIKPILVYAPALNECVISPATQILDEKINIENYSPENVDKKFHGYVSVDEALSKSYNIPSIKILSYVGIEKAKNYASKVGITFDESDEGYALALGGMTYGVSLKELTSAYVPFARGGYYNKTCFVSHITDNSGKLLYVRKIEQRQIFRDDTAFLITSMLQNCAKYGTAKKLNSLSPYIASKTGTNGNGSGILDAYNISYSTDETLGVWCGNLDNTKIQTAGGNEPTKIALAYFKDKPLKEFEMPSSVCYKDIDLSELDENHKVVLANKYTPTRYKKQELFSRFNLPEQISENFTKKPEINATLKADKKEVQIELYPNKICTYKIYYDKIREENLLNSINEKNTKLKLNFDNKDYDKIIIVATYTACDNHPQSTKEFTLYHPEE